MFCLWVEMEILVPVRRKEQVTTFWEGLDPPLGYLYRLTTTLHYVKGGWFFKLVWPQISPFADSRSAICIYIRAHLTPCDVVHMICTCGEYNRHMHHMRGHGTHVYMLQCIDPTCDMYTCYMYVQTQHVTCIRVTCMRTHVQTQHVTCIPVTCMHAYMLHVQPM